MTRNKDNILHLQQLQKLLSFMFETIGRVDRPVSEHLRSGIPGVQ